MCGPRRYVIECCVKGVTFPHAKEMGKLAGVGKKKSDCIQECVEAVMGPEEMATCCSDIVWWCDLLAEILTLDNDDDDDAASSASSDSLNDPSSADPLPSKTDSTAIMNQFYATVSSLSPQHMVQFSRFLVDRLIDKSVAPNGLTSGMVTVALTSLLNTNSEEYSDDILLVLNGIEESLYDMNAVHDAAEKGGFWRVCGGMNGSVGDVRSVVLYYLKDEDVAYKKKAFKALLDDKSGGVEILLEFLVDLITLDAAETVELAGEVFLHAREKIMAALTGDAKFLFIREVVRRKESSSLYGDLERADFVEFIVAARNRGGENLMEVSEKRAVRRLGRGAESGLFA